MYTNFLAVFLVVNSITFFVLSTVLLAGILFSGSTLVNGLVGGRVANYVLYAPAAIFFMGVFYAIYNEFPKLVVSFGAILNLLALWYVAKSVDWKSHRYLNLFFAVNAIGFLFSLFFPELVMQRIRFGN